MFIIPGLQTIFNAQFVAKYIVYLWAKFRESGSNGSFVIATKPKWKKKSLGIHAISSHSTKKKIF